MSRVQVLSAVQFGFAFFRKSRFRRFRSLRSEKIAKWIGIFSKKSRDEKTGEIFRNLPFSLVFSCGSILTTQHGRGRRNRTLGTRFWRPLLYLLSYTPVQNARRRTEESGKFHDFVPDNYIISKKFFQVCKLNKFMNKSPIYPVTRLRNRSSLSENLPYRQAKVL